MTTYAQLGIVCLLGNYCLGTQNEKRFQTLEPALDSRFDEGLSSGVEHNLLCPFICAH